MASATATHATRLKLLMSELRAVTDEAELDESSRVEVLMSELNEIKEALSAANQQVKEKEQLLDVYKEVGDLLWSADDPEEKASRFAKRLFDAAPFYRLIFSLVDKESRELKVVEDLKRVKAQPDSRKVKYEIERIAAQIAASGEVKVVEHPDSSVVFMPVEVDKRIVGVLMFTIRHADRRIVLNYIKMLEPLVKMSGRAL